MSVLYVMSLSLRNKDSIFHIYSIGSICIQCIHVYIIVYSLSPIFLYFTIFHNHDKTIKYYINCWHNTDTNTCPYYSL
jgi:hypothetical protein